MILNGIRKCIGNFNLVAVTIQKMIEREMDNRGSKSILGKTGWKDKVNLKSLLVLLGVVKEQRVDGSWHIIKMNMSKVYSNELWKKLSNQNPFLIKNNYNNYIQGVILNKSPFGILCYSNSKSINLLVGGAKYYSSLPSKGWVSGFVDAEGCFRVSIIKNKNFKGNPWQPSLYLSETEGAKFITPLSVRLYFQIGLHLKDEYILQEIKSELGVGKIYKTQSRPDFVELQVTSLNDLALVIDYFDKNPLITQKRSDYLLFKEAYGLLLNKQHLTINGLKKLVEIKTLNNKGLTENLKKAFPELAHLDILENRPVVDKDIESAGWLSGFVSGEGSFGVILGTSKSTATGYQPQLRFQITQQIRDKKLMEKIIDYLGCGYISIRDDIVDYRVTNVNDILTKVIPFFKDCPIIGVKSQNFADFCLVANIIKNKEHLTIEGINKIRKIKSRMNTLRDEN